VGGVPEVLPPDMIELSKPNTDGVLATWLWSELYLARQRDRGRENQRDCDAQRHRGREIETHTYTQKSD
jgi:hypothetical protein